MIVKGAIIIWVIGENVSGMQKYMYNLDAIMWAILYMMKYNIDIINLCDNIVIVIFLQVVNACLNICFIWCRDCIALCMRYCMIMINYSIFIYLFIMIISNFYLLT